jgi:hypothetical protein
MIFNRLTLSPWVCALLMITLTGASAGGMEPTVEEKIDINCATLEQLCSVPLIDCALAKEIVEYRKINGTFKSREALLSVPGMTPERLDKLTPWLDELPSDRCTVPNSSEDDLEWEEPPLLNISNC